MVTVNTARCPQDHKCPALAVCPVGALSQEEYSAPVVDTDKCINCKKCVHTCPLGALEYHES